MRLSDVSRRRAGKTYRLYARRALRACACMRARGCVCACVRSTRGGGGGGGKSGGGGGVLCRRRGATEEIRGQDVLESRTCRRPCRERVPDAELRPFLRPCAIGVGFSLLGTDRAPRYTAARRRARRFPYVLISAPACPPLALSLSSLALRPRRRVPPTKTRGWLFLRVLSARILIFAFFPFLARAFSPHRTPRRAPHRVGRAAFFRFLSHRLRARPTRNRIAYNNLIYGRYNWEKKIQKKFLKNPLENVRRENPGR